MRWPIAIGLFGLLAVPALGDEPRDERLAELGRGRYAKYCASCHGQEAVGDGPLADKLATPPADLTRIAARRGGAYPVAELAELIDGRRLAKVHGPREMPVWGERMAKDIPRGEKDVDEAIERRIDLILRYLKTLQVPAAAGGDAPQP